MKTAASVLSTLFALQAFSQAPATQKVTQESGPDASRIKKVFAIAPGADSLRQGRYEEYCNNNLVVTGNYKDNYKDGVWERQYQGRIVSRKTYRKGQRTGTWEFFNRETPAFQYDASNNAVFNLKEDTSSYYYFATSGQWIKSQLDSPPIPLASPYEWQTYLNTNLVYPPALLSTGREVKVDVEITVDEFGNPTNYQVIGNVEKAFGDEALRVVKAFGLEFVPSLKEGMKIRVKYLQTITFKTDRTMAAS